MTEVMVAIAQGRSAFGYSDNIELSPGTTLPEFFSTCCQRFAQRPAFTCMGQTLSFAEVDHLSDHFASYLQRHTQLQVGDRVAVQLPNSLQYPVVAIGLLKAGMVLVNTNPLYTSAEMGHQFMDADVRALVVLSSMAAKVEQTLHQYPTRIERVIVTDIADLHTWPQRVAMNTAFKYLKKMVPRYQLQASIGLRRALQLGAERPFLPPVLQAEQTAVLQYTGGTTGVAKGAMLSHDNLNANRLQCAVYLQKIGMSEQHACNIVAPLPFYHIYAFMVHMLLFFGVGHHSLLVPNPRELGDITRLMRRFPCHGFVGINTLFNSLIDFEAFKQLDFGSLTLTLAGGMALQPSVAQRWQAMTGCAVVEGYGLTEASPVVSLTPPGSERLGTIGLLLANTEAQIVDEAFQPLPVGQAGELCVRGPQVMQGYWNNQQASEGTLVEGWLLTGDIAVVDPDGFIRIVDRRKDVIIVSGFNVYPNEVEAVIATHPDVQECAVIGVPDEHSGEVVKLFVVRRSGSTVSAEDLRQYAKSQMTGYKVPKLVEFRESLPKSNVGKILRRELRDN